MRYANNINVNTKNKANKIGSVPIKNSIKNYSLIVFIIPMIFTGCKKEVDMLSDREIMEKAVKGVFESGRYSNYGFINDEELLKNLDMMVLKFENKIIDPEPVIVIASFIGTVETEPKELEILCYDEDRDVIGIGIKEKYIDSNGFVTNLTEEYPVAFFRNKQQNIPSLGIPINIRDLDQRKSEQDWKDYINSKSILATTRRDWYSTLPKVWISLPEVNKTEVEVYVYDKKGHKSNITKVIFYKSGREGIN